MLTTKEFEVVAVEPSSAMRAEGARLHSQPSIRWIGDRLPDLAQTLRLGLRMAYTAAVKLIEAERELAMCPRAITARYDGNLAMEQAR